MKPLTLLLLLLAFAACNNKPNNTTPVATTDTTQHNTDTIFALDDESKVEDDTFSWATYYVVIADTGLNYYNLDNRMYTLSKALNIVVDTMERSYTKAKDLIALSDSADDEMYAGAYYPRRDLSEHLSLEYLNFYKPKAGDKTIALVCGIYETRQSADSALSIIKRIEKNSFTMKANVYIGCMH